MMTQLPNPAITVILAGGKAARFDGLDKGEIIIKGARLVDIIHERLLPQSSKLIISGTHNYNLNLPIVPDIEGAPGGPVGGLYSIWAYLKSRHVEGFFTAAIDGPNVPSDLTAKLYDKSSSAIAVNEQGRHPTYAWWRMEDLRRVFGESDLSSSLSLNRLADALAAKEVPWAGDESFININRFEDLSQFLKGL